MNGEVSIALSRLFEACHVGVTSVGLDGGL